MSIRVSECRAHGQESWRIDTSSAIYVFQQAAGGFSSILDPAGCDWLSYRPGDGPRGEYRGIPNMVYPEGIFHPGCTVCESRILEQDEDRVVISSSAEEGAWACEWVITEEKAVLTMLKAAHPYWFLYEGTPGGKLDEQADWVLTADEGRQLLSESWDRVLPSPKWVIFGDGTSGRGLFLCRHTEEAVNDCYWPMEHAMTVFGFGRAGIDPLLNECPARFTVSLLPADACKKEQLEETLRDLLG